MTQQEIDKQVAAIRKFTDDLIAKGPEACKEFLVKIGVIPEHRQRYKCLVCGRDKFTEPDPHICVGGYRKRGLKWEKI